MRVRLVVPTSRSTAPDFAITSGMRNEPPISTNSPRETMHLAAFGQRVQRQQHRGGVVVDDDGRDFALGRVQQFREQAIDVDVALAALAGGEVEFQVRVALRDFGDVLQRARR